MRLIAALLVVAGAGSTQRWFADEDFAVEQAIDYEEFEKTFYGKARSSGFTKSMEEYYRIYARECHNFGNCKKWKRAQKTIYPSNADVRCPEQEFSTESWPETLATGEDAEVTINSKIILLEQDTTVGNLIIAGTGKLIFKDYGDDAVTPLTLRAKSIKIQNGGELWIGSRQCRYQGKADIVLYGNKEDMTSHSVVGEKYLWTKKDGTLEIHGKEKKSWTKLNEHLFKDSVAAEKLDWQQSRIYDTNIGNRFVLHVLSAEGDLKDIFSIPNGDLTGIDLDLFLDEFQDGEKFLFFTDFVFELSTNLRDALVNHGFDSTSGYSDLLDGDLNQKYSQIAGIFDRNGNSDFISISPDADGSYHFGLKGTIGPIPLTGEKSGFDFTAVVNHRWKWNQSNNTNVDIDQIQRYVNGDETWPEDTFLKWSKQQVTYSSSTKGDIPIIELVDDVSSWEVGDQILVASTSFEVRESETFTIMDCPECNTHQIKLDRPATFTHWGRIDSTTGIIDQRAEVGLLSRNVRFYGEMSSDSCQYAKTREQLNPNSANENNNWCWYFKNMEGVDRDMHGAHMITTHSFKNWHVSHTEFFNVGQPRLARYPIHWHHAGYVGERGGYADPSSAESNSIHDSFSRWVTIHGTHEAIVKDNVGYNCVGHGYFMEDGYEEQNLLQGNLGVLVKPGILLPNERHKDICFLTNDGFEGTNGGTQTVTDNDGNEIIVGNWWERACEGLSVFWIANIQNFVHDNAAVGGFAGIWVFTHSWDGYGWQAIPKDPITGIREWRNNKASASFQGFTMDETVKDLEPSKDHPEPQFSINDVDSEIKVYLKSMNDPEEYNMVPNGPNGPHENGPGADPNYWLSDPRPNVWANPLSNWARLELNGWNLHHTMGKNWARNANVHLWGWQFSDNHRGYVIKTTSPIMGAQKSLGGSTFLGMSKNTGHRYCAELIWKSNLDFVTPKTCASSKNKSNGGKGASAVVQIAYTYTAMGYDKNDEKAKGGIVSGEQSQLFHPGGANDAYFDNGYPTYWPAMGQIHGGCAMFWFKPSKSHVYRQWASDEWYPTQGISVYDSWLSQAFVNNDFYNFYSDEGSYAYRHAIGIHASNNFHVIVKNTYVTNQTYHNVDRHVQMSRVNSYQIDGDKETPTNDWGDNYGTVYRDSSDGERTMGYSDLDGHFNNGTRCFVMNPDITTIFTGCRYLEEDATIGVGWPGVRICPMNRPQASIKFRQDNHKPLNNGLQLQIQSPENRDEPPLVLSGTGEAWIGDIRPTLEAFKTFEFSWLRGQPPPDIQINLSDADKGTWYRLSLCIGQATVNFVENSRRTLKNNAGWSDLYSSPAFNMTNVDNFDDLNNNNDTSVFYHDQVTGWLHLKVTQEDDRRVGGEFTDRDGNTWTVADSPNIVFDLANDLEVNYPSIWNFNMPKGAHFITVSLDGDSYPETGETTCGEFNENPKVQDLCEIYSCAANENCQVAPPYADQAVYCCPDGFAIPDGGDSCEDIDECQIAIDNNVVSLCLSQFLNSSCNNIDGGYECLCDAGFEMNDDQTECVAINFCAADPAPCHETATCTNGVTEATCECADGAEDAGDGTGACIDSDECTAETHDCADNAVCTNNDPGFECACPTGFSGDGVALVATGTGCSDVNECEAEPCPDNSSCANNDGSYECNCDAGFTMNADSTSCDDIDECTDGTDNCHDWADCTNNDSSFTCLCQAGTEGNGVECVQIDECILGEHNCDELATCNDIDFTFECACPEGYAGTGISFIAGGNGCFDIDECTDGTAECPDNSECDNNDGGYDCNCVVGYKKPANGNNVCKDVDECTGDDILSHDCLPEADCTNNDGSFTCACKAGFNDVNGDGSVCDQIDECTDETDICHELATCTNVDLTCTDGVCDTVGFTCECNSGYQGDATTDGTGCTDIDECTDETAVCPDHSTCANNDGGYDCNCDNGYKKPANGNNVCKDIDECTDGTHTCPADNSACANNDGGFECSCNLGYEFNLAGTKCKDINECDVSADACGDVNAECTNNDGSFDCACKDGFGTRISCPDKDECTTGLHNCAELATCTNLVGSFECSCPEGYSTADGGVTCQDVDECADGSAECPDNSTCANNDGGYECNCDEGWKKPANGNNVCKDIDECTGDDVRSHDCLPEADCTNNDGSFTCACKAGFNDVNSDGTVCEQIDECAVSTDSCHESATCTNVDITCDNTQCTTEGFTCACNDGFSGDGQTDCSDVDECADGTNDCPENSSCGNLIPGFECTCDAGYKKPDNGNNKCKDIDECTDGSHNCHDWADCTNTDGSFECACQAGTSGDGLTCEQVNECDGENNCDPNATCTDINFDYLCACNAGFTGDGFTTGTACSDIDECTDGTAVCPDHSTCENNDGSYECNCDAGWKKPNNGKNICKDIDECSGDDVIINDCNELASCTNIDGSFTCACNDGFNDVNGDGSVCDQVDECSDESHTCNELATCTNLDITADNTAGFTCACPEGFAGNGFDCADIDECTDGTAECPEHSTCANNDGAYECNCDNGYKKPANGNNVCKDIDECELDTVEAVCGDANAICTNNDGSYDCACMTGFGRSIVCPDIDECTLGTDNCSADAACTNTEGSFECACNSGFDGDGVECTDKDECATGENDCPENSTCNNISGGFECNCNEGYKKPANGKNICKDVDECTGDDILINNCGDFSTCSNNDGSFICACDAGFADTNGDGTVCDQVDECDNATHNCNELATCTNLDITADNTAGFTCECNDGFEGNGVDCQDIDECAVGVAECPENASCTNNDGGFDCNCNEGFELNADTGACDLTVIPECECDLKTQVCDESTGTCSCKPGYLEDSSIDGCVFDFSVCPDNVKDTEVTWIGKTMRRNFVSKDSQDIVGKIKMKKMPEKDAYTGFLVFTKLYCGSNFIEAIADGSLYIEFLDKQQQYEMTDFNYFRNANTGSFATTTKQFQNTQNTLGTNTGTNSQDIVWFAIRNVDQIDMGSKKLSNCINRVQVGVMESTDQDLTGCVGHARNVDW